MVLDNQTGSGRHQHLAQTVQSYPSAPIFKHATTGTRNSTSNWYIKGGLYTDALALTFADDVWVDVDIDVADANERPTNLVTDHEEVDFA